MVALALLICAAGVYAAVKRWVTLQTQALANSRSSLQSIFDNMTDGIAVFDLRTAKVEFNHAAMTMLGLQEALGEHHVFRDHFEVLSPHGELVPMPDWPVNLALRGTFVQHRELIIRNRDTNHHIFAEISTAPVRDKAGKVIQIIIGYRDLTERKQNMDTQARLAAIVDSSEDAIVGKDDKGIVRSWNAAAERIFGYTAGEMIGQSILKLVPRDREQEELGFMARIKRGEVIDHIETLRRKKSGKPVYVSLTISPIRDAMGKVVGASKIARDITDRKQMERQLQQSQKMEAIGQLTGGIAHDFNNLLGVVVGNLSLVERLVGENEAALKRVRTAQKAAARGGDLTRRLLAFSSNEELNPVPTILGDSIRNMIELAGRTIGPEIKMTAVLDEALPPVFVDAAGLESALLNLAVNARDAMPRGGSLTISSGLSVVEESFPPVKTGELKPGRYATVSVTDTGEGMSRETMERALEPFFTTKPRGKGTGLGLAMVYGFVKQSGGTVRLYSEIGYGTTVTFYLQLAEPDAQIVVMPSESTLPGSRSDKVLVVDDEPDLLDIAAAYLGEMGLTALCATDGASALLTIEHEPDIALVVTDVIMPGGINGVELVQQIRERRPGIKVIYSSGFPADALAERSGTLVDGELLKKPYQRGEFAAIVRDALQGAHSGVAS